MPARRRECRRRDRRRGGDRHAAVARTVGGSTSGAAGAGGVPYSVGVPEMAGSPDTAGRPGPAGPPGARRSGDHGRSGNHRRSRSHRLARVKRWHDQAGGRRSNGPAVPLAAGAWLPRVGAASVRPAAGGADHPGGPMGEGAEPYPARRSRVPPRRGRAVGRVGSRGPGRRAEPRAGGRRPDQPEGPMDSGCPRLVAGAVGVPPAGACACAPGGDGRAARPRCRRRTTSRR